MSGVYQPRETTLRQNDKGQDLSFLVSLPSALLVCCSLFFSGPLSLTPATHSLTPPPTDVREELFLLQATLLFSLLVGIRFKVSSPSKPTEAESCPQSPPSSHKGNTWCCDVLPFRLCAALSVGALRHCVVSTSKRTEPLGCPLREHGSSAALMLLRTTDVGHSCVRSSLSSSSIACALLFVAASSFDRGYSNVSCRFPGYDA